MTKNCAICGGEFVARTCKSKTCSEQCRRAYQRQIVRESYHNKSEDERKAKRIEQKNRFAQRAELAGMTPWKYKKALAETTLFGLPDGIYEIVDCPRCPDGLHALEVYSRNELYAFRDEDALTEGMVVEMGGERWRYRNTMFEPMEVV